MLKGFNDEHGNEHGGTNGIQCACFRDNLYHNHLC